MTSFKPTDTQLVILSAAAARDDGAIFPLPKSLKLRGAALDRVLRSLLMVGVAEERPAKLGEDSWRETDDGQPMTLVISAAGLKAIGVAPDEAPGLGGTGSADGKPDNDTASAAVPAQPPKTLKRRTSPTTPNPNPPTPRPGTKQAALVKMLGRKRGATIAEIGAATGWQQHSVRGVISGVLKKKLGLTVASEAIEGRGRVYRIVSPSGESR